VSTINAVIRELRLERKKAARDVKRLDAVLRALRGLTRSTGARGKRKRHISAAARRRISQAQKARWRKFKARNR
jgi:hypothetical protein